MNVKKPTIHNKIYSEIIFLMGDRKVYSNHFAQEFDVSGGILGKKDVKKQSVLYRQLETLRKEDYLGIEKSKKNNRTYYFVLWEKIIEEFLDYAIDYMESYKSRVTRMISILTRNIRKLQDKSFREKSKKNYFVRELFIFSFWQIRQIHFSPKITIADVFEYIMTSNVFEMLEEDLEEQLRSRASEGFEEKYDKQRKEAIRKGDYHTFQKKMANKISEKISKTFTDREYKFFSEEFSKHIYTSGISIFDHIFRRGIPLHFSVVLTKPEEKKVSSKPRLTEAYS